jgi:transcriptional regulator with XRE-family HTH domain
MSAKRTRKISRDLETTSSETGKKGLETASPETLRRGDEAKKKDCETAAQEALRLGDKTGKVDCETAAPETLGLGDKTKKKPKKKKKPVRKGAVWWVRGMGHPMLNYFGAEVKSQRDEKRGWTLGDLRDATGLSKSFLSDLENGKSKPTEEVILELEAGFGMKPGALMGLTHRRWKRELKKPGMMESLMQQIRQVRRAWLRDAFAAWLGGLLPLKLGMAWEETASPETGRLGDWETGRLGDWETGRLGDWETGRTETGRRLCRRLGEG